MLPSSTVAGVARLLWSVLQRSLPKLLLSMMAKVSTLLHYAASSRPVTNELAPSSPDSGSPGPSRKRRRDESGEPRPVIPKELIELFDSRIADLEREMAQKLKKLKGRVME